MTDAQKIAKALGQNAIADRMSVGRTAVSNALSRVGKFPPAWMPGIRQMCVEARIDCPEAAFNFKTPSSDAPLSEAS